MSKQKRKSFRCVSLTNCCSDAADAEFARRIFQRDGHAAMLRKDNQVLQRSKRRIERSPIRRLPVVSDVLDQIREKERARLLPARASLRPPHPGASRAPDRKSIIGKPLSRPGAKSRSVGACSECSAIPYSSSELANSRMASGSAIIKVRLRTPNFDVLDTGAGNLRQNRSVQRLPDIAVRRENPLHSSPSKIANESSIVGGKGVRVNRMELDGAAQRQKGRTTSARNTESLDEC